MTDATSSLGSTPQPRKDPTTPATPTSSLNADTGAHTPPASANPAPERKSFSETDGGSATASGAAGATPAQLAADADALLRASLETIRTKAEDLRRQTTDWAGVRGDQAREIIDERPLTVVAAAFGLGLLLGMAVRR